jgi:hypothetical protein
MALGTQARGKLLDYEEFIDHQLRRTRTRIKMTDLLTAVLLLVTAGLAILFVEVLLDHAFALPVWCRQLVLFVGLTSAAAFAAIRIVRPLIGRVNGLYAARTIEASEPEFKNGLINYLSLKKDREHLPKSFLAAIEKRAVDQLSTVDVEAVVNNRRAVQTFYLFCGIVMAICVYASLTPKPILESVRRAFLEPIAAPTNTQLKEIKPGDATKVAGEFVEFSVSLGGARPEGVTLHYSVDGGDFFAEQPFAPGKLLYDPWKTTLRDLQRSMDYYITGGDARSITYHIEVLPAPMVTSVAVDMKFPAYTGVAERLGVDGGSVSAIEGTIVTVHARTNQPARSGKLDLG